jgi:hypothetical protein
LVSKNAVLFAFPPPKRRSPPETARRNYLYAGLLAIESVNLGSIADLPFAPGIASAIEMVCVQPVSSPATRTQLTTGTALTSRPLQFVPKDVLSITTLIVLGEAFFSWEQRTL